jgi:hypothetical protein
MPRQRRLTATHSLFLTPFFKAAPQKVFHPKKAIFQKESTKN